MIKVNDVFCLKFKITNQLHEQFIAISGDDNVFHTDSNFAKSKGFPDKFMHGNLLNTKLSYVIGKLLPTENVMIVSETLNYRKPFYLNDELELSVTAKELIEFIPGVDFSIRVTNQNSEIVANGKILIKLL